MGEPILKELLQQSGSKKNEGQNRLVYLFVGEKEYEYAGDWQWDLHADAVFCSDVMLNLPVYFIGTKGIIHPDDKALVLERIAGGTSQKIPFLQFRIITTYGEVKVLTGRNLEAAEVACLMGSELQEQGWQKEEQDPLRQARKLAWQKRAGELAERLTGAGTWYYEVESNDLHYSDEVFRMYGLPRQSLNAHLHTFTPFIHPDDRDTVTETFARALREQLPLHLHYRIVTPNGQEKMIRQSTHWEFNDRGGLMLYGTVQDITELRAAEQKALQTGYDLQLTSRLLQLSEQAAHIGHWHINLLTRKTVYADSMYRLHSLKPGAMPATGNTFLNFVHPEDRDVVQEVHKKILQQHTPPDIDYRIIRHDGKVRHLRQRGRLIVYGESEMLMLVTLQDVSAEVIAAHKLAELRHQVSVLKAVQQQAEGLAEMGSWMWEPEGDKITWSESLYNLLGTKPALAELTQKHLTRAILPEDRKNFGDQLRLAVDEKQEAQFEFRILRLGETRQLRALFRLINFGGKELVVGILQDLTRQIQVRQELTLQATQNAFIAENMLDRAFITDTGNTIRVWNQQCERVYGLKQEASIGKNIFDVLPQLKTEEDLSLFNRALNGETITILRSKSGPRPEHHELHLTPMRDEAGKVTGILHLLHDVTREQEMQQRLAERLNFIESLVEASVDRILVMDRYMNYLYCNRKAADFYGLSKEDIIGKNVLELFPASVNDPTYDHFRKALKGETVHIPAIEGISDEHYFEVFLIPIIDNAGNVSAVLWIHHDLSSEIRVQKGLRKSDEIVNTINAAFVELDGDYRVRYMNETAETYFGRGREELFGKIVWEEFALSIVKEARMTIEKAATERVRTEVEYYSNIFNKWVFLSVSPSTDGVLLFFYDRQDIKEAQQKLQAEHRRLKEAQAIGKIGSFEWNVGAKEVSWSGEMYRITGLEPGSEAVTIEQTEAFVHPDEYEDLKKLKEAAFATPGMYQLTHRIVLGNGTLKWVNQQFESVADEAGTVIRVHGTLQDITERTNAEQELLQLKDALAQRATDKYLMLFNSIDQGFCIVELIFDANGDPVDYRFMETNPVFEAQTGLKNAVGKTMKGLQPAHEEHWFRIYGEIAKTGEPKHFEQKAEYLAGGIWYDVYALPFGKPEDYQVAVLFHDITDRKKAEETVRQSEEIIRQHQEDELFKNLNLLKQAEEVAGLGSWEYRISEDKMTWSEGMYQLFDLEQGADVKKETYLDYVTKEDKPVAKALLKKLRAGVESFEDTLTIQTREGTRKVLKIKSVTVKDSEGKPVRVLGVDLDITELVKTEETLKALNRSLDQRNKELEAKNEELANFSYIASHDLREPLRKIHTFSDWLQHRERENLTETGQNYLKRMSVSVERMDRLIEDVLVLTRMHAAAFNEEPVDLNDVLFSVKGDLAELIKLTKTKITADKLPLITGNRTQLQHLFKNLISNAIKFQKEGVIPKLIIRNDTVHTDEIVALGLNIEKAYFKICVTDNGIGIEKQYYQKIFQIFQRLHGRTDYEGTGVGLAICKRVMENHQGTITVESTPGNGSVFCCYFPQ